MIQKSEIRRKFQSNRKIFFKDVMPSLKDAEKELEQYKSDYINLQEFDKKLYVDPMYSQELPISNVVYANLKGNWVIDSYIDDYGMSVLKFIDDKSGQSIELAFPDAVNKMKFANEIYTSVPTKQEYSGMGISDVVNTNTLYENKKYTRNDLLKVAAVAAVGIVSAIFIKKKMKSKKDD